MAMRARVELIGSLTHNYAGRSFKKSSPQILTDAADIRYYQSQACFSVAVLDAKEIKAKEPATPPIVPDEDINDDGDNGESDEGYTAANLDEHKKAELKEIAAELGLDVGGTKKELINKILGN